MSKSYEPTEHELEVIARLETFLKETPKRPLSRHFLEKMTDQTVPVVPDQKD